MLDIQIQVPGSLTDAAVVGFSRELQNLAVAERYVVDLSRVKHVEPFGMLVCASVLRRFIRIRKEAGGQFTAVGFTENSYAAHMGLYQAFGLPYGNKPGEASGSSRYIPLTCISVKDLKAQAGYSPVGEAVEREAQRLSRVLLQKTDGSRFSHISYALLEMMRNVVEHSFAPEIWCAAQCWPNKNCVEIAILDEGIGVKKSLQRNPANRCSTDQEALELALQAGVSGAPPKSEELQFREAYDDGWQNAGLGLFIVSKLCAEGGSFSIVSGNCSLSLSKSGTGASLADFAGTAVRMKLESVSDRDINTFIDRILPKGAKTGRSGLWPPRGA